MEIEEYNTENVYETGFKIDLIVWKYMDMELFKDRKYGLK